MMMTMTQVLAVHERARGNVLLRLLLLLWRRRLLRDDDDDDDDADDDDADDDDDDDLRDSRCLLRAVGERGWLDAGE